MPGPWLGAVEFCYDVTEYHKAARYTITGVTRDSGGTPLADCVVEVYETDSGLLRGTTTSDASGNYLFDVTGDGVDQYGNPLTFFVVAYKAGSPDVSGTTINTLVGASS